MRRHNGWLASPHLVLLLLLTVGPSFRLHHLAQYFPRRLPVCLCRSERVAGIDAPNYNENARLLSLADGDERGGGRDRRLMRGELRPQPLL
jgi:hypothetical protein